VWDPLVIAAFIEWAGLVFWTEGGIRKVVGEVIAGQEGAAAVRKHVTDLLHGEVVAEVGVETRKAAEQLAENAKASLHRKLNAIYAAQCERLDQRLAVFTDDLDKSVPDHERRLEGLTARLDDVESSCEGWLEQPRQQLK
jgi:hypothetical protein